MAQLQSNQTKRETSSLNVMFNHDCL